MPIAAIVGEDFFLPDGAFREIRAVRALVAHKLRQRTLVSAQPGFCCPGDGHKMVATEFKSVKFMVCLVCCGAWLEREKFEKLMTLIDLPRNSDLSKLGISLGKFGPLGRGFNFHAFDEVFDWIKLFCIVGQLVIGVIVGILNLFF